MTARVSLLLLLLLLLAALVGIAAGSTAARSRDNSTRTVEEGDGVAPSALLAHRDAARTGSDGQWRLLAALLAIDDKCADLWLRAAAVLSDSDAGRTGGKFLREGIHSVRLRPVRPGCGASSIFVHVIYPTSSSSGYAEKVGTVRGCCAGGWLLLLPLGAIAPLPQSAVPGIRQFYLAT